MIQALGYLSILETARKEMDGTANIQIFKGQSRSCTRWCLLFKDCCNCGGWGVSLGLSACDEDSKKSAQLRNEGKCVQIGAYCAEKEPILKTCIRRKTVFCCFGNKFAKLLQEQGKRQLGQDFGSPEQPNCRGFTAEELIRIDFSKLDLAEISRDIAENFKPADVRKHFAKGDELQKIREAMGSLPITGKMQSAESHEGAYLNENMKHLTQSAGIK
jgi:conjugal transfer mating pair stabilization protein TraN